MTWALLLAVVSAFASVALLTWLGFLLFTRGWQSYEEKYVSGAERTLDAMYLTIPAQHLVYLSFISTVIVALLVGFSFGNLLLGLVIGGLAFPLPRVIIHFLKRRRDRRFGVQLVDALMSMGNALRAGLSLPMALEMIAREAENPMGQEMRLVVQEMRVGVSLEVALQNLYNRMASEDLDLLMTSILISREVGGNLTEVFGNIAETIRERHRIEGKVAALTAQGKLQGIVVALLPVGIAVFLNLWNPELMRPMYTHWIGGLLLALVVALEVLGIYFIRKITKIEV